MELLNLWQSKLKLRLWIQNNFFSKLIVKSIFHCVLVTDEGFSFMDQLNFVMVLGETFLLNFVLRFFLLIFSCWETFLYQYVHN